jgi:hypothetical protein
MAEHRRRSQTSTPTRVLLSERDNPATLESRKPRNSSRGVSLAYDLFLICDPKACPVSDSCLLDLHVRYATIVGIDEDEVYPPPRSNGP